LKSARAERTANEFVPSARSLGFRPCFTTKSGGNTAGTRDSAAG